MHRYSVSNAQSPALHIDQHSSERFGKWQMSCGNCQRVATKSWIAFICTALISFEPFQFVSTRAISQRQPSANSTSQYGSEIWIGNPTGAVWNEWDYSAACDDTWVTLHSESLETVVNRVLRWWNESGKERGYCRLAPWIGHGQNDAHSQVSRPVRFRRCWTSPLAALSAPSLFPCKCHLTNWSIAALNQLPLPRFIQANWTSCYGW